MTKKIFAIITNRFEEYTKYALLFVEKFINEIDKFYLITTEENYENLKKYAKFNHETIFFDNEWFFPKRVPYSFYYYGLELAKISEEDSIIYVSGDGGFYTKNPFKHVEDYENNFNDYDVINTLYNNRVLDTACFFKNNDRSKSFLKKIIDICEDRNEKYLIFKNKNQNEKHKINELNPWVICQDLFWNIYLYNNNICTDHDKTLISLFTSAKVYFFKNNFHYVGDTSTSEKFIEYIYDYLLLDYCLLNLKGKYKNCINIEIYKYIYDNINSNIKLSKNEFVKKFLIINETKLEQTKLNYSLLKKKKDKNKKNKNTKDTKDKDTTDNKKNNLVSDKPILTINKLLFYKKKCIK